MTSERFFEASLVSNRPDRVTELKDATEQIHDALLNAWTPEEMKRRNEWSVLRSDSTPSATAQRLDPNNPTTIAAMWTAAVVNRARRSREEETGSFSGTNVGFKYIWRQTRLEALADRCEENVESLSPRLENQITTIDVNRIKASRKEAIQRLDEEILVFAGTNGSGKDFMIRQLTRFLEFINLKFAVHKMPNPDGKLFPSINLFLKGDQPLNPMAAQFLFFADAFDTKVSSGILNVFNRHPAIEAMVYGPKELQTTVLSTHPLTGSVIQTIIIDRCPASVQDSVHKRGVAARVFERDIEQVLHQRIRYAELTKLPGFSVINADFGGTISEQKVRSVNRLLSVALQMGIIQRNMVKVGRATSFQEANEILDDAYWDFKKEKDIWLDHEFQDEQED